MLTILHKKLLQFVLMATVVFSVSIAQADINLTRKYQYQGQITAIDKARRLLTIETTALKGEKTRSTLITNTGVYEVAIGIRLKNVPKSERYSGLKYLQPGILVHFNVKHGTEKNKIPTITEMWVEFQ